MSQQINEEILAIIAKSTGKDINNINLDQEMVKELQVDSLKILEIISSIEYKYSINIPNEELFQANTPRKVINLVLKYQKA